MKNINLFATSALVVLSFATPQRISATDENTWGEDKNPSVPIHAQSTNGVSFASPQLDEGYLSSVLPSLKSGISQASEFMNESALKGCDRFSQWIGTVAKDLPAHMVAKSLLEVDYVNDSLFWQGHFYQEIQDINKSDEFSSSNRQNLKELQNIVWNGFLSPYDYNEALFNMISKKWFFDVLDIRKAFRSELQENPSLVLPYLRGELSRTLTEMQDKSTKKRSAFYKDFHKKLSYYRDVLNAFDYAETLGGLLRGIQSNKAKLSLSETQFNRLKNSLTDALRQVDKQQYLKIKAERYASQLAKMSEEALEKSTLSENLSPLCVEENISSDAPSLFSYPLSVAKGAASLVKQSVSFALENPGQTIAMGLSLQAAAVAAGSAFKSPVQNSRRDKQAKRMINDENNLNLGSLTIAQGFSISDATLTDDFGYSVASAGDFNGDGLSDVIIGARYANNHNGSSSVIYGTKTSPANMNLASLTAAQGFTINGANAFGLLGISVASAGDFNGDGQNDVIVGAYGTSYVIYGTNSTPSSINLASLTAAQGITISGVTVGDEAGRSVSSAGDFNGDGLGDVIIGAIGNISIAAGDSYVVYGTNSTPSSISLASLTTAQGFTISGATAYDLSGWSVASAGDFNGDGLNDVIIGAPGANVSAGKLYAGKSYVIYGTNSTPSSISLGSLTTARGFTISGANSNDNSGTSVASAGDFNGDGLGDIIIGAPNINSAGNSYVIYGTKSAPSSMSLASLTTVQGFTISGANSNDNSGHSVATAGDFNGDGLSDVIIGADNANSLAGNSYIIYGTKSAPGSMNLGSLTTAQGFTISGATAFDLSGNSVATAGDFNGDGLSDVIIGAINADKGYVIYGAKFTEEPTVEPTREPTVVPTAQPTTAPTVQPTIEPTEEPTVEPTIEPTTATGTAQPTAPITPTKAPTIRPTIHPTKAPTVHPTKAPTVRPTRAPTVHPTTVPTSSGSTLQPNYFMTGAALLVGAMKAVKDTFFTNDVNTLRDDKTQDREDWSL